MATDDGIKAADKLIPLQLGVVAGGPARPPRPPQPRTPARRRLRRARHSRGGSARTACMISYLSRRPGAPMAQAPDLETKGPANIGDELCCRSLNLHGLACFLQPTLT